MTDFDMSDTLAPKSDQLDGVDLAASGPQVFTITKVTVKKGAGEQQPVSISLAEFPRVWRPNLNTRRVLAAAWGGKGSAYVGRRVRLFYDPDVHYGGKQTGGIRVSHMSDLPGGKPFSTPIILGQGRPAMYTVDPLTEPAPVPQPTAADVAACTDLTELAAMHAAATSPELRALIRARKAEITEPADGALIPSGGAS